MPSAFCRSRYITALLVLLLCTLFVVSINVVSCGLSCFLSFVPDLTLRRIDDHYSWDLHGITHILCIYYILYLLQMERETEGR